MSDVVGRFVEVIIKCSMIILSMFIILLMISGMVIYFFNANQHKSDFEKAFNQKTGQTLILKGPIKVNLFPIPHIHLNNALLRYYFKENNIEIVAEKMQFNLKWNYFFTRKLDIKAISGENINIKFFEKDNLFGQFSVDTFFAKLKFLPCEIQIPLLKLKKGNEKLDGNLHILFKNNYKNINMKGKVLGGNINLLIDIQEPNIKTELFLQNLIAGNFLKILNSKGAQGGILNVKLEGNTMGDTFSAWINHFLGEIFIQIQHMRLESHNTYEEPLNVFSEFWRSFEYKHQNAELECAIVKGKISKGQIELKESIGAQTKDLDILGTGKIDLQKTQLNVIFHLSPRNKEELMADNFNSFIYVKGNLPNPQVITSMQAIIQEGGMATLEFATKGISLFVEKLLNITSPTQSPCDKMLESPDK